MRDQCDEVEGKYANYFKIGYNPVEFVIDFAQFYQNGQTGERVHTRIITSPLYAKRLLALLGQSLEQYEKDNGAIPDEGP